jgi:hypothetical protein
VVGARDVVLTRVVGRVADRGARALDRRVTGVTDVTVTVAVAVAGGATAGEQNEAERGKEI